MARWILICRQRIPYVHSAQHPFFDLAYADDTLIVARTAKVAQLARNKFGGGLLEPNPAAPDGVQVFLFL